MYRNPDISPRSKEFLINAKRTKDTKGSELLRFHFLLRALRDLRGENVCFNFGSGSAPLCHCDEQEFELWVSVMNASSQ